MNGINTSAPLTDGILISVIIPTRNRCHTLRDALEAMCAQTLSAGFEVIVVDNRSTDETPALIEEIRAKARFPLTFHVMPENRGPGPSRNKGAQLARGGILAFTDSDCRPRPDWLERGLQNFADDLAFLCGPILNKPEQPEKFLSRGGREVVREHPSYPWGNVLYRRDIFLQMGGSDDRLCFQDFRGRPVECCDTDLAWKIKDAGYKYAFIPEMVVYHELELMTLREWLLEPFSIMVLPVLIRHHPKLRSEFLHWRLFFQKQDPLLYLAIIGLMLAVFSPWALLLAIPYMLWLLSLAPRLAAKNPPKLIAQIALFAAKHCIMCGGLVYGSVRSRCLVL